MVLLGSDVFGLMTRECGLEELAQCVERVAPGIALILDEAVQYGYAHGIVELSAILDGSGKRSGMREVSLRQEGTDFDFRVNAGLAEM